EKEVSLETLQSALHKNPADRLGWLALADCLEEIGQPQRAELARLFVLAHEMEPASPARPQAEARLRELLATGVAPCAPVLANSVGMNSALVPPGTFLMGASSEDDGTPDEPPHPVEISRAFYLGVYPVTQEQYQTLMGTNPSHFCAGGGSNRV